ncbi:hypothetical protein OAB00_02080 [Akkermansiaceae bacterium]|nr:hypothetical protein [Akkermansiaceae bacterium]
MTKFKLLTLAALFAGSFALNSCCNDCCTGVLPAEQILPLPHFGPMNSGK